MNVDPDLFATFAFHAGLLAVKTLSMAFLIISRQRIANKNFISSEDGDHEPGAQIGVGVCEDVERVRRAHQNDLENILPFLSLGLLYLFTGPSLFTAKMVFRSFSCLRIVHTIAYLSEMSHSLRALCFFGGMLVNLFLGFNVILHFLSAA